MLDGVMLLWFILTGLSVAYVAIDILTTPEATVMKWGFVILTCFAGPLGAFFYVLGCREPLPGTHEAYVSARWRQVLGSTMHCAAGDGLGIVVGAAIGSMLDLGMAVDIALEYGLGFGFGWLFFQAFAMRDMAGGDYLKSLRMTFIPEFFSMNILMVGMLIVSKFWMPAVEGAGAPSSPAFWFIMSIALVAGFLCAYPMNWWLVTRHLKHGMMTVRPKKQDDAMTGMADMADMNGGEHAGHDMHAGHEQHAGHDMHAGHAGMQHGGDEHGGHDMAAMAPNRPSSAALLGMGALSVVLLAVAVGIVMIYAPQG
ncbi:MAG: DUF4396 domain-containing protein [Phycisphaerales bacterium]|nr:DUF4396 domain-containing protein [Phycisphaerales bacterium]